MKNVYMLYNGEGYEIVTPMGVKRVDCMDKAIQLVGSIGDCFVIPKKRVYDLERVVRFTWAKDDYQKGYEQAIKDLQTVCKLNEWEGGE